MFRELVIYDADQCYPEYLVLYKRKYAKAGMQRPAEHRRCLSHIFSDAGPGGGDHKATETPILHASATSLEDLFKQPVATRVQSLVP